MAQEDEELERGIIELIAVDRIDIPISSMSGKLKRRKPKIGKGIDLADYDGHYEGERTFARIEEEDRMKARGMKEGIDKFAEEFPRHGAILRGYIAEQRVIREVHLYFGLQEGRRLASADYMGVMRDLGFSDAIAERLYGELMDVSRRMQERRKRSGGEERSVLIG